MELKEFIAETLTHITEGVELANMKHTTSRYKVLGESVSSGSLSGQTKGSFVDFDVSVAITKNEGKETKTGMAIAVTNLLIGTNNKKEDSRMNENVQRLKFRIFIANDNNSVLSPASPIPK